MFRESPDPVRRWLRKPGSDGGRHAGRGVAMQYRADFGGPSVQVAVGPGVAPAFVRLRQSADTFVGETSQDGTTWTPLGEVTLPGIRAQPGLVVTSHDNTKRATAQFDEVRFTFF